MFQTLLPLLCCEGNRGTMSEIVGIGIEPEALIVPLKFTRPLDLPKPLSYLVGLGRSTSLIESSKGDCVNAV